MTKEESCDLKSTPPVSNKNVIKDEINKIEELFSNLNLKKPDDFNSENNFNDIAKKLANISLDIETKIAPEICIEKTEDEKNEKSAEKEEIDLPAATSNEESKNSAEDQSIDEEKEIQKADPAEDSFKDVVTEKSLTLTHKNCNVQEKENGKDDGDDNPSVTSQDTGCEVNDLASLKISLEELKKESAQDKDDDVNYLRRGPMTENKSQQNRYVPFQLPPTPVLHPSSFSGISSPDHEKSNSKIFDVIDFSSNVDQSFGSGQNMYSPYNSPNYFYDNSQQSPDSYQSYNSPGQYNLNNSQLYPSQDSFGYTETLNDDWSKSSPQYFSENSNLDNSNNAYSYYQPLTPPKDPSPPPVLQDDDDCNNLFSSFENENQTKSDDLISILKSIQNDTRTEPRGSPETELLKLKSVLEDNKDMMRHEMGMYLKEEEEFSAFQAVDYRNTFDVSSSALSELPACNYNYEGPLTPPYFVPSLQDSSCDSPLSIIGQDLKAEDELDSYCSEEHLSDILKGIDEINPEELNIYLEKVNNVCDPSYARNIVQAKCKPNALDHAFRRLSTITAKQLCKKDVDGDTCLMIVYSKPEDSNDFYENVFSLQEKVREVRVCCETPLGKAKKCKSCGNSDASKFYTPLSFKNKQGDSALSCAVKTNHSEVIVNYLLDGILHCEEDFRRIFDDNGKDMLSEVCQKYLCLRQYI